MSGIIWEAFVWVLEWNRVSLFGLLSCTEILNSSKNRREKVTEMCGSSCDWRKKSVLNVQ